MIADAVPNDFRARLHQALNWAQITPQFIARIGGRGVPGLEEYLGLRPVVRTGLHFNQYHAALVVAEQLAVSADWLHNGNASQAARRLVLKLESYELGVDDGATVQIPLKEFLEIKALAASVPGPRSFHH